MNQESGGPTIYVNCESKREYHKVPSLMGGTVRVKRIDDGKEFTVSRVTFIKKYDIKVGETTCPQDLIPSKSKVGKLPTGKKPNKKRGECSNYRVVKPDPERYNFSSMVLYPECVDAIRTGVNRVLNRDKMEAVWNVSKIDPEPRTVLNFWGVPGTGKTRAAYCIAAELNIPLHQANYSEIVGSLHGGSGKNIAALFKAASKAKAILFLDEADNLVSARLNLNVDGQSCAQAVNSERTIFMQELDKFSGVVILTTNFLKNYDQAILRRVAQHVEFKLPDRAMREQLFRLHVPSFDRVRDIDWLGISLNAEGLSGGDIYQVMINAIHSASMAPDPSLWWLEQHHVMAEIQRVRRAKEAYKSRRPKGQMV